MCRVRFVGGAMAGATLDLPEERADAPTGRLVITAGGQVFDARRRPEPGSAK